jgi:peptidoglycan hydrolase-like protein with peptidoglycan-binding domain
MCLVEVPASYKTVRKQVVVKPATVREIEIPAEYQTVKVTKMVSPPQEKRISIPAEYETISRTEKVSDGYMEWKRVLCETNLTPDMVSKIQDALMKAGYDPGPVDGMLGAQTQSAIQSYQKSKGLAEGDLTYETVESLGVMIK